MSCFGSTVSTAITTPSNASSNAPPAIAKALCTPGIRRL